MSRRFILSSSYTKKGITYIHIYLAQGTDRTILEGNTHDEVRFSMRMRLLVPKLASVGSTPQ